MLTVAKITQGAAAGYAQYLEGRSTPQALGDYYLRDGDRVEAPGRWAQGAATFGLENGAVVTGEQLRTLLAVRRPDTGQQLRPVGGNGMAVAAIDATFSAPKSVSAIWAVADPELRDAIEVAQERAVDAALGYAVARVEMIRQRRDGRRVVHARAQGVVATSWRHTTARAVPGRMPDPQLHSHVLLHGAVRGDGQVMAIDSRAWLVGRREVGAAYRSQLARELTRLGFEVVRGTGRGGRYFELAGVPEELIEDWSGRDQQIRAAIGQRLADHEQRLAVRVDAGGADGREAATQLARLRQTQRLGPREDRLVRVVTRTAKTPSTHADLDREWQTAAAAHGLWQADLAGLRRRREPLGAAEPASVLARLTASDAVITPQAARAAALEASAGVPLEDAVGQLRELHQAGQLLRLADGRYTTRAHRGLERDTARLAGELVAEPAGRIDPDKVRDATGRLEERLGHVGGKLSDEQRAAIEAACSTARLVVIEGQAGTGKSTVLEAVALAHQADGQAITVISTAALTADRVAGELRAAGVTGAAGFSTAAFRAAVRAGTIDPAGTIVHEEAALGSTRDHHDLLAIACGSGARVILVGDGAQSQPVAAGGMWPRIADVAEHADANVRLTANVRARDPVDRDNQARFRAGQISEAVGGYQRHDRIVVTDSQREAEDRALEAAHQDEQTGKQALVITQTSNRRLDALNARAQAIRLFYRELGAESVQQPGRPYWLHAGDPVQVRRTVDLGRGGGSLRNGTQARVAEVDPAADTVTLQIDGARTVALDHDQRAGADLRLAYVQHPFPAQGQTTDSAHLIASELSTREGSYVAITRARERTMIYTSDQALAGDDGGSAVPADRGAALAQLIGQPEPKAASIDTPLAHEHDLAAEAADRDDRPELVDDRSRLMRQAVELVGDYRAKYQIAETDMRMLGPEPDPGAFTHRHERNQTLTQVAGLLDRIAELDTDTDRPDGERAQPDRTTRSSPGSESDRQRDAGFEP